MDNNALLRSAWHDALDRLLGATQHWTVPMWY